MVAGNDADDAGNDSDSADPKEKDVLHQRRRLETWASSSKTRTDLILESYYALLEVDVRSGNWIETGAQVRGYYVRGFTTFRRTVLRNVYSLQERKYVDRMAEILRSRDAWQDGTFDWEAPYAGRQAVNAASPVNPHRLKFQKAIQAIVLCEAAAELKFETVDKGPPTTSVYEFMRIEPAMSFIHGFDKRFLEVLLSKRPDFLQVTRHLTGQQSLDIFYALAHNHTVTHKLATRIFTIITKEFPDLVLGQIDYAYNSKRSYPARTEESFGFNKDEVRERVVEMGQQGYLTHLVEADIAS